MEITWRDISRGVGGRKRGEKVQRISSITGRYKINGEVKNSMGNGEAKELIYSTHGHELKRDSNAGGRGGAGWRGIRGRKMGQL